MKPVLCGNEVEVTRYNTAVQLQFWVIRIVTITQYFLLVTELSFYANITY